MGFFNGKVPKGGHILYNVSIDLKYLKTKESLIKKSCMNSTKHDL